MCVGKSEISLQCGQGSLKYEFSFKNICSGCGQGVGLAHNPDI